MTHDKLFPFCFSVQSGNVCTPNPRNHV